MDLMQMIQGHLTPDVINQLSQESGASPEQTETAAQGIISTLLGGLAKNTQSEDGASGVLSALNKDHDGSILNDVMGLVTGAMGNSGASNGMGILGHILGGNQQNAATMISQVSGVNQDGVMNMMAKLAPVVMGVLGQANSQQGGLNVGGLASLLGGAVQQQSSNPLMQMATQFLDRDGDGSVVDDLMGMGSQLLSGFFKR